MQAQQPLLPSYGYLESSHGHAQPSHGQPLCGNGEGWGPISPIRFDFTPCFLDVWVAVAAAWGLVGGAGALWYLSKCPPQPVKRDWHFYAKLV
jgi:ATP-binding cassette subfamily C (CFTR/MRP) protein 1